MKKIILSLTILTLIGAGCSVKSNNNLNISSQLDNYKVSIVKSEVNKNILDIKGKNPTTISNLMNEPGIKFDTNMNNGQEKVTMIDGVITTASKVWNLYLNDKKIEYNNLLMVKINPTDKIEWRYEVK